MLGGVRDFSPCDVVRVGLVEGMGVVWVDAHNGLGKDGKEVVGLRIRWVCRVGRLLLRLPSKVAEVVDEGFVLCGCVVWLGVGWDKFGVEVCLEFGECGSAHDCVGGLFMGAC